MRRIVAFLICSLAYLSMPAFADGALLSPLFQDHAVLQRDTPIRVWGHAAPGAKISVTLGSGAAEAVADAQGNWSARLPAMGAGGPYTLTVHTDAGQSQTASDILVGDVYLCSGQSNMELPVKLTLNAMGEIYSSANDQIRLLKIPNKISAAPLSDFPAPISWEASGPATVADFSAACYYFAKDLQKRVQVPLGLIDDSWGGSNIRTWMSDAALRAQGGLTDKLDVLALYSKDPAAGARRWGQMWEDWWHAHAPAGDEPWSAALNDSDWGTAPADMGYWTDWNVPELAHFVGGLWYRTTVTLTAVEAAEASTLSLGTINEEDETWVNGEPVGNTFGYAAPRSYALAAGTFHEGENSVVVNVLCTWKGCGMFGPTENRTIKFADGTAVPLTGPWHYKTVPLSYGPIPRSPWGAVAGLSMAYNAMIAPLHDMGLRGVLWYQGESNTGEPETYRSLLSGLMTDWRRQFAADLPFLIVQLPDFGPAPIKPEASGWAEVREAERQAVANDANAALVVTIDIGSHTDIHPADKESVGTRLARAARALIYGEKIVPGGPVATEARREGQSVVVRFAEAEDGLVAYDADQPIGFELCATEPSSCRYATAHIKGDEVWVDVPEKFAAAHVRYCWADGPICTLFDGARLPAGPFELQIAAAVPAKHVVVHRATQRNLRRHTVKHRAVRKSHAATRRRKKR